MLTLSLEELEAMPTIKQGHTDDLKISTPTTRVWLSRLTVEDGQPYNNMVTVEQIKKSRKYRKQKKPPTTPIICWHTVDIYEAKPSP